LVDSVAFAVFGVDWEFFKPYIVIGLAAGGAYALSGVGIVVLYQATGVLNLAFGAIGAAGALISYYLINHHPGVPEWIALGACIAFGGVVTFLYGVVFGPFFARREPLVKMMGTLALALVLLGIMTWRAPSGGAFFRVLELPTSTHRYELFGSVVSLTQILALVFAIVLTIGTTLFLKYTKLGTAYRAIATDREITATLGVPVRWVEASAWLGSGIVCGTAGLLLADLFTTLAYEALAVDFLIGSLAAALIGRLSSLTATLLGGLTVGLVQSALTPYQSLTEYRTTAPFVIAIVALLWLGRHRVVVMSKAAR
jgi:branched-chain amino acid transport system permease protein